MKNITTLQESLTIYLKQLKLDEAAILFIMLTLKNEAAQEAMVLYLRENPNPTQEELMATAVELQEISETKETEFHMVQTPKDWEEMELVKTTTAYGNEVMVPRKYIRAWEIQRRHYEEAKKADIDTSIGVESLEISMSMGPKRKAMLMTFYEKYQA